MVQNTVVYRYSSRVLGSDILLGKNTGFSVAPPLFLTVTTVNQVITHSNQKPGRSGK